MNTAIKACPHGVVTTDKCGECDRIAAERLVKAKAMTEQVLQAIEKHSDKQQQFVMECGLRLRELACFYGPYFKLASMLTSCEIASGDLLMSTTAPCEEPEPIMLPGMRRKEELREIILPGNETRH